MRRRLRRDPANDRRVAKQGDIAFWMTLAVGLAIAVAVVVLAAR